MTKIMTLTARRFSIEQCRTNPKTLFVFGDNLERIGEINQAVIRSQKNSIGLATKKAPSNALEAFFTDMEYTANCKLIDEEIDKIKVYIGEIEADSIAFPFNGLGTGLSAMQTECPKTFCYLTVRLIDEFMFNNLGNLKSA